MDNVLVRCADCGAINRIKTEAIYKEIHCGNCRKLIVHQTRPMEVDGNTFQKDVLSWPGLVLVEFWSSSCVYCRMLSGVLDQIASEKAGLLRIAKINTSSAPILAQQFGIQGVPYLVLFRGGRKLSEIAGALPKGDLERWISTNAG